MKTQAILFASTLAIAVFSLLPAISQAANQKQSDCCAEQAACCAVQAPCCAAEVK